MKPRQKTRTDYHIFYPSDPEAVDLRAHAQRWFRPLLWLSLGFMLGMLYYKTVNVPNCETLAYATVNSENKAVDHKGAKAPVSRASSKA